MSQRNMEHPVKLIESLSLQSVSAPPNNVSLRRVRRSSMSQIQVDTVRCVLDSLRRNKCFLLGDGTGTGKGRVLAATATEWAGPVVWVSANARLCSDVSYEFSVVSAHERPFDFATYASLLRTPLALRENTLLILDECHLMRNCGRIYKAVSDMIRLHRPCVLYSSATAMSDSKHLEYLHFTRCLWDHDSAPFASRHHLMQELQSGNRTLLELICMYFKERGMYVSRQLSLEGVEVSLERVHTTSHEHETYARCVAQLEGVDTSSSQRVLFRLMTSFKVKAAIRVAERILAEDANNTVVFMLSNTCAASSNRHMQNGGTCPIASCNELFAKHDKPPLDVPLDALDAIVDHFGAEKVAEITGRTRRYVRDGDRWAVEPLPKHETEAFQDGRKRVAIISKAGGVGLSLNGLGATKRHGLVLELPWSSEDFVQMLGRIHRTSSSRSPSYTLFVLNVPAEERVAHSLHRRVRSMGSLSRGDAGACDVVNLRHVSSFSTTMLTRRLLVLKIHLSRLRDRTQTILAYAENIAVQDVYRMCNSTNKGAIASILLDMLKNSFDDITWAAAALVVFRRSLLGALIPWNTGNHHLHDAETKAWVRNVLLCSASYDSSSSLCHLPNDVVIKIVELALTEHRDIDNVAPYVTYAVTHESLMNQCLRMPFHVQRSFVEIMQRLGSSHAHVKERSLLNMMRSRLGASVDVEIESVRPSCDGHSDVVVTLAFTPRPCPTPPEDARFYRNRRSCRVQWVTADETAKHDQAHVECTRDDFVKYEQRRVKHLTDKISTLSSEYHLATESAICAWHVSTKQLVEYNSHVGLLLQHPTSHESDS